MSGVNGVTTNAAAAYGYKAAGKKENAKSDESKNTAKDSGVVYEPSKESEAGKTQKYKPDAETIARLKADAENRKSQLLELVQKMISGQANAQGKADSIWNLLREGKLNVDAATREQAAKDISEDGYWGVKQTSDRILEFATALTGGDPKKINEMQAAFEKGFKQAEKMWGGKLPEISQKTFEAVIAGFDKMREDAGIK
jgi:hypothetical protein